MPQVPRVTNPSVELRALPNAMLSAAGASPEAFGAGTARLLGQGAELLQRQQERDDADTVFRAEVGLKTEYLQFERDELGRQGADAKGAADRAGKWWGEASKNYSASLKTDRQRRLFDRSFQALQIASSSTLMRHEQAQLNKSLAESAQARVGAAIETALGDPTPERIGVARKEITDAVAVAGQLAGHTPEISERKKGEALTMLHKGIVMRMVDADPDAAKAYYYGNKKEIDGSERAVIEKALEAGGIERKAQEVADEVLQKFPDEASAFKHIEATYSGKEETRIKHEVAARWNLKDAVQRKGQEDAYGKGRLLVAQGQRVPQTLLLQMGDGHAAALIEHQQARVKAAKAEAAGGVKTDFATWNTINQMAAAAPEQFAKLDLGRFQDRVSKQDLMEFANLQRKVQTDDGIKEVVTSAQQIGAVSRALGLKNETQGQFEQSVHSALAEAQRAKGKPLTYDERQKVIDQQTMQVAVPGWVFDSDKRAFELTPDERAKAEVKVPDADRQQIIIELQKRKKPVTDAEVLRIYKAAKGLQ